ncbi:Glucose dehydrogenase [FAD, quinone] [Orchesella cincta]|uniref:Glucose dehydrogenase [FAD, quinone] n=1 Tax=Orchesella cincta TaxID=48709 RepID=A0A1D2M5E8_ORCCI|nr:Glucose dehydrogenase [FAD, quinone] [Orchesella cincta]
MLKKYLETGDGILGQLARRTTSIRSLLKSQTRWTRGLARSPNRATDKDVLLEGVDLMFKLLNSTTMQKYGAVYREDHHPACKGFEFFSRKYWKCVLNQKVQTVYHSVGPCSLGSVVDSKFRVQGILNLRVADASVFPAVPNANINGPVMMLAEKAAGDIFQTWRQGENPCHRSSGANYSCLSTHVGYDPTAANYFLGLLRSHNGLVSPHRPVRTRSVDSSSSTSDKMPGGSGAHIT